MSSGGKAGKHRKCAQCGNWMSRATGDICKICEEGIRVPASVFRPILERLVAERDEDAAGEAPGGGLARLLRETDKPGERVHSKTLGGVLSDGHEIYWNTIDRVLTRTGNSHLWYKEPLIRYFHEPRHVKPKKNRNRKHSCPGCKKIIDARSAKCRACYQEERKHFAKCVDCEGEKSSRTAQRCWDCYCKNRYGGFVSADQKRWDKSIERVFTKSR